MYTVKELLNGYKNKQFSPVEITKEYLERAKSEKLNAYIAVTEDIALAQAEIAEDRWLNGSARILEGIPISYKDNIYTKDIPTTSGSKIDQDFIPNYNASVVDSLNQSGTIMTGKVNMHEFAFGITNNNPFYGAAKNPWNPEKIPGGSSGGSAVSVATDLCVASIGTDTGGSVRIPAASCGLVGLKPTRNLIKGSGITPLSWTLDHIGPITKNIDDLLLIMNGIVNNEVYAINHLDIKNLNIGIPTNFFNERIEEEVLQFYTNAIEQFERLGAKIIKIEVPGAEEAMDLTFTLAISEAGYTHKEQIQSNINVYGDDVKQILGLSTSISAPQYISALKRQNKLAKKLDDTFNQIDILLTPTLPALPKDIGQEEIVIENEAEPIFDCMNRYTNYFNITGNPAITIPTGISNCGLPVGIQLVGAKQNDSLIMQVAKVYEENYLEDFYQQRKKRVK